MLNTVIRKVNPYFTFMGIPVAAWRLTTDNDASDPTVVARAIRAAVESPAPKSRYAVGYLAKLLLKLNRLLPDRLFDWIVNSQLK